MLLLFRGLHVQWSKWDCNALRVYDTHPHSRRLGRTGNTPAYLALPEPFGRFLSLCQHLLVLRLGRFGFYFDLVGAKLFLTGLPRLAGLFPRFSVRMEARLD